MQLLVYPILSDTEQAKIRNAGRKWGGNHKKKYYYRPRKKRLLELQAKLNLPANELYAQMEREQDHILSKSLWPR